MRAVTDQGIDPEVSFVPRLRPTSHEYWAAINRLWGDGTAVPNIRPVG